MKYVLRVAGNSRLQRRIARESRKAILKSKRTGRAERELPTSRIARTTAGVRSAASSARPGRRNPTPSQKPGTTANETKGDQCEPS